MTPYLFKLPDLGEGTVEAELVAWHVRPGDHVQEDQVIAEVMTDKAAVELPSPVTGKVLSITGAPGDRLPVGGELISFDVSIERAAPRESDTAPAIPRTAALPTRVMASPSTRRRAHEAGIDLTQIRGSGPDGRIIPADIESVLAASAVIRVAPTTPATPSPQGLVDEIKVTGLRRVIAERMSESKRTIPHFSYVEEIDVTELESLRRYLNAVPSTPTPLSVLPFIMTALVRALEKFPQCNAHFDAQRNVIVRYRSVHVGVATQTSEGLLVPVLRNAETLSIFQLATAIRALAERARARKCTRDELTGSTITVSSLGKLGGVASVPVINAPEVALIGVNKSVERPMVVNGVIAVRQVMNLSSAFDHRFVDGHDAAALIQQIKETLEHPATLFIR